MTEIREVDELRDVLGVPLKRVAAKERDRLHAVHRAWLAASCFCILATSNSSGTCDASPKGDPPGRLVHVVDDVTLALAERPGNRRADGWQNVLSNPHVGLVFLIPGRGDTLRVNGTARLLVPDEHDAPYVEALKVQGRAPALVCEVTVQEVYFHCSKAFSRASLWNSETWRPDDVPSRAEISHAVERSDEPFEDVLAHYTSPDYGTDLY